MDGKFSSAGIGVPWKPSANWRLTGRHPRHDRLVPPPFDGLLHGVGPVEDLQRVGDELASSPGAPSPTQTTIGLVMQVPARRAPAAHVFDGEVEDALPERLRTVCSRSRAFTGIRFSHHWQAFPCG